MPRERLAWAAYMREYRRRNPDVNRRTQAAYAARHPERNEATAVARRSNQRAKKFGVAGHITQADVLAMWERNPSCVTCGVGRGIDHIVPLSEGGTHDAANIQTMCGPCNSRKNATSQPRGFHGRLAAKG